MLHRIKILMKSSRFYLTKRTRASQDISWKKPVAGCQLSRREISKGSFEQTEHIKLTACYKVLRNTKAMLICGDAANKHGFKKGE